MPLKVTINPRAFCHIILNEYGTYVIQWYEDPTKIPTCCCASPEFCSWAPTESDNDALSREGKATSLNAQLFIWSGPFCFPLHFVSQRHTQSSTTFKALIIK